MPVLKRKVFAYVTHRDAAGERLLVFSHPLAPEAGIQVPAGTLEEGETPEQGALREAQEETGLDGLEVVAFLGEQLWDLRNEHDVRIARDAGKDEVHHRYFFHLRCAGQPPERWRHYEEHASSPVVPGQVRERPLFELFWARLPGGVPALVAGHGALLPRLLASLQPTEGRTGQSGR